MEELPCREVIRSRGHPNIKAHHPTTFEITRDDHLSPRGDCIIGIAADKGLIDFSKEFRENLIRDDAILLTRLSCGDMVVVVRSRGSGAFQLDHPGELVWRKSTFVCGRTVGIGSDVAARDLPREMVARLAGGEDLLVELTICRDRRRDKE